MVSFQPHGDLSSRGGTHYQKSALQWFHMVTWLAGIYTCLIFILLSLFLISIKHCWINSYTESSHIQKNEHWLLRISLESISIYLSSVLLSLFLISIKYCWIKSHLLNQVIYKKRFYRYEKERIFFPHTIKNCWLNSCTESSHIQNFVLWIWERENSFFSHTIKNCWINSYTESSHIQNLEHWLLRISLGRLSIYFLSRGRQIFSKSQLYT